MAQDFSLRYPLIKGQGNFGSTDFGPAADRYTEAKLTKLAEQMLEDLDKKTVPMGKNYDNSLEEPLLLPSKIPNLLVNGSSGIAVGMATNMPPHNIKEICQGIIATLQNPEITIGELMHYIKGPDFPTGAIITGTEGLYQAYTTGKGKIIVKAKHIIENNNIVITELPYQISKKQVIENIADLVKEKVIEGIADIRDESDKEGLRIFIKLKKDTAPEITLNQLYAHTSLKTSYSIANIALHEGQPKVLTLKALIEHYLTHRRNVIRKRTQFDLTKAEERQHIVEGLIIAITHIDPVIALIKQAADLDTARQGLIQNYNLTEKQANAILDMKLSKLTNLETKKLNEEYEELKKIVIELQAILASAERINNIIKEELQQLIENYGDERKTTISTEGENIIQTADLIEQQDIVITLTQSGYIKQLPLTEYKQQRRGGKGVIGTGTKEEDVVRDVFITNNHNTLLFFTNKGKIHWLPAYDIPEGSRYAKGKALVNVLALQQGENVSTILPIQDYNQGTLFFATKQGTVKRTELKEFSNPRKGGILAINLEEKDELISALLTD
ncbi:MAG: DNA gyrase subunit A, partial [Nanoarchaeota archaeon]|nr:DNA gyrase subunit A [Nanoarchaeota archaeon]